MTKDKLTYEGAFEELQEIMEQLQNDEISVDDLTKKVKRASELISFCNKMLRDTETKISDVIKDLGI